jgi:peptidoglycan/LPS O-acetylase OafA/YrhL
MPERLHSLDVLRGVAILAVMLVHWPGGYYPTPDVALQVVNTVTGWGYLGVDLFFVLSGFLISGLLFDELDRTGRLAAGRFWLRRGFKIWPAYFVGYGALTVATALAMSPSRAFSYLANLWPYPLLLQSYTRQYRDWPASWSLAVEEHFYLALPLVVLAAVRLAPRRATVVVAVVAALAVVVLPVAKIILSTDGAHIASFYRASHFRADQLAAGVLACYLARRYRDRLAPLGDRLGLAVAVAALAAALVGMTRARGFDVAALALLPVMTAAFAWLVVVASARPAWGRDGWTGAIGRPLAALGVYSYTVYIAHGCLLRWPGADTFWRALEATAGVWGMRAVYLAAAVAAGVALSHAVERPMLAARARWVPSGRRRAVEVAPASVAVLEPVAARA